MKKLHNEEDRKLLLKRLLESKEERKTLSFYQYAKIPNPQIFRDHLFIELSKLDVLGRIYIAKEGVNAQISVPSNKFESFKEQINNISFLKDIRLNIAIDDNGKSFIKLKIKVRDKILADGLNDENFDVTDRGSHLNAKAFNELSKKEDTLLIDMRNHYEHEVGYFKDAITPDVDTFRESLPIIHEKIKDLKDKNIVMYCTGGIRCEKASAWLKHKGFKNVHQLEGGIIEYARQVKENGLENRFIGKNFVFDERRGERISDDVISKCHQCGEACDEHTNCVNDACHLLFIQCENCKSNNEGCCSPECVHTINLPVEEQKALRKGINRGNLIFKKGRSPYLNYKQLHNSFDVVLCKLKFKELE